MNFMKTLESHRHKALFPGRDEHIPGRKHRGHFRFNTISALVLLLYLPIGGFDAVLDGYGDLILILYLLTIPSLAMAMGGFASNSPYATVGAQREIVMMMSYELPLATVIVAIAWRLSMFDAGLEAFSLDVIQSHPLWLEVGGMGVIGLGLLLLALMIVFPAEVAKIPFDAPEAETEMIEAAASTRTSKPTWARGSWHPSRMLSTAS